MNDSETAPRPPATRRQKVLLATDFSEGSDLALRLGWTSVASAGTAGELHIVHVMDGSASERARDLEARRAALDTRHGELFNHVIRHVQRAELRPLSHPMTIHVRVGKPAREILQTAADVDADLLVVGSHGKSGLSHAFGSVSRELLSAARLPLLVGQPKRLADMRTSEELAAPCPDCVATREQTGGERWWCDVHGRGHIDVHGVASTRRRGFAKSPADSMAAYR